MWPFSRIRQLEDETALELARRLVDHPAQETTRYRIEHDGFEGIQIGTYTTLEGKEGVVLQQVGSRVVHVYGRKWLVPVEGHAEGSRSIEDREQVAKVFAYIWHGDAGEWRGFLSKADAFLAYPWPQSPAVKNNADYVVAWRWKVSPEQINWQYSEAPPAKHPVYNLELLYSEGPSTSGSSQPATPPAASADISLAERSYLRGKGMSDEEIDASHSRSQPGKTMHPWVCCYCDAPLACEKCGREQPSELS